MENKKGFFKSFSAILMTLILGLGIILSGCSKISISITDGDEDGGKNKKPEISEQVPEDKVQNPLDKILEKIPGVITDEERKQIQKDKKTSQGLEKNLDKAKKQASIDALKDSNRYTPVVRAANKVGPAVVGIVNKAFIRGSFSKEAILTKTGSGSGVIYDASGLIVTNNHVVKGAQELDVQLADGRILKGRVLGADAATDLAVVKVDGDNLPVAMFGTSKDLMVGEPAIAIGNPLGEELEGSVTAGVISALNRSISIGEHQFQLIQTDAAINPGNSGGALVNADGLVIGINSAKIAGQGVEGLGFAIPIDEVKPIIAALEKDGRVLRPYFGAVLADYKFIENYAMKLDLHNGLLVWKLVNGGPAYKAGIRTQDIIVEFDNQKPKTVDELRDIINKHKIGDKVKVKILRDGDTKNLTVSLGEMPPSYN
jgi:serine protease Do